MRVVLIALEAWLALDALLLVLWLALVAYRERADVHAMVLAAERYANSAWPAVGEPGELSRR